MKTKEIVKRLRALKTWVAKDGSAYWRIDKLIQDLESEVESKEKTKLPKKLGKDVDAYSYFYPLSEKVNEIIDYLKERDK